MFKIALLAAATLSFVGCKTTPGPGTPDLGLAELGTLDVGSVDTNKLAIDGPITADPALIQPGQLIHQGAFRVPTSGYGTLSPDGFAWGGTALAYNPANDSLFLVGHDHFQMVAEISIPAPVKGSDATALPTANALQPFADATEGKLATIDNDDANKVGGLMVYDQKLYGTAFSYYDSDASQTQSSFVRSLDLAATGTLGGMYAVGAYGAGPVSGWMVEVPESLRASLGGPMLIGQCCIPIISRTSHGPAAFVFDPADFGKSDPVPATPLVHYPADHALSPWDQTSEYFNGATAIAGAVLPKGTRSLLFFGRQGAGEFCYGHGVVDESAKNAYESSTGDVACIDPSDENKGNHAYPYRYQIWAYDVAHLAAVKSGTQQAWDAKPYKIWELTIPFANNHRLLGGVAYDAIANRIFISQFNSDEDRPLIHVFTIQQ